MSPPQHLSIVTGASRGMGRAIAAQLLARGHRVLAMARGPVDLPVPAGAELLAWSVDLAAPQPAAVRLEAWLREQDAAALSSATLINNAGVVARLAPLADIAADDLVNSLRVGLEAPLLLSAAFLRATQDWQAPRKLLFISSGLGRRGMAGSASYCEVKAGLDNLARALVLEEAARPNGAITGARVASLAPGVIDTDMQTQLRSADPALFPDRETFVGLQTGGKLASPDAAASAVLRYLDRADFGSQPVADVRDA